MKLEKKNLSNVLLIVVAILVLFTPVGFHLKVFVNRLVSFSPSSIAAEKQKELSDYHWELINHNGQLINLEEKKGQVIIVNMWATWCPPCVAEMPSFQKLYEDYGDKVSFLFVAKDQKDKVAAFLAKKDYTLPVYYEKSKTPIAFESNSIPMSFLVDKAGLIKIAHTGAANWNSEAIRLSLDALLAE